MGEMDERDEPDPSQKHCGGITLCSLLCNHHEAKPESWIRGPLRTSAHVSRIKEVNLKEERRGRKKEGKGKRKENVNASVNQHKDKCPTSPDIDIQDV